MKEDKKLTASAVNANSKAEGIKAAEEKKKKKEKKGPGFFAKIGKKIKEVWSELKLVSWPTFPKVVKQTGVVLLVVLIFLVLIALFDWPLSLLLKAIAGNG